MKKEPNKNNLMFSSLEEMQPKKSNDLISGIQNGFVNSNEVNDLYNTMVLEKLNHMYDEARSNGLIWKGKGSDQRWKFKTAQGKTIAKTKEETIRKAFISYLKEIHFPTSNSYFTFKDLYFEWLEDERPHIGKEKGMKKPNTFKRYQTDYTKYIEGSNFENKKINNISATDIEKFLFKSVDKHSMTESALKNIFGYIKMSFKYALKSNIITTNPCELVNLSRIKTHCKDSTKKNNDRIFSVDEIRKLRDILHRRYKSSKYYIQDYAIELAILTGMRVGELAALRWDCITDTCIKIMYSEHRADYDDRPSEYYIGETKNYKYREFPLYDDIRDLLEKIKNVQKENNINSEYIFANKKGRVNAHTISCAVYRRCENANIEKKCIHSIRRTVSSHLRITLPAASVANMLGHLEETNNQYYNYDVTSNEKKIIALHNLYDTNINVA